MASVTKTNDGKSTMGDEELPDADPQAPAREGDRPPQKARVLDLAQRQARPGYFTIYKKGQGYWTRMGTVIGLALVGGLTAYNLYAYVPTFLPERIPQPTGVRIGLGVALGFLAAFVIVCWKVLNKPTNVDFLIATDSEMKKVNWTSRKELIGSTKVVILFMFLTALFLFVCDLFFITVMNLLHVLKFGYFGS